MNPIKRGMKGKNVREVQEWLCLHDLPLSIDGDFGPATEQRVKEFQEMEGVGATGIVNRKTYDLLTAPLREANEIIPPTNSVRRTILKYARKHLRLHPREIGGQNMGPWVRYYMEGNEGKDWPWCAGFVSKIVELAHKSHGMDLPDFFKHTFSCDVMALTARNHGRLYSRQRAVNDFGEVPRGSIFLRRRATNDWNHTGIVIMTEDDWFKTIEGNTNDEGSNEGYEVCKRVRAYKNRDFIIF